MLKCVRGWPCTAEAPPSLAKKHFQNYDKFRILLYDIPAKLYEGLAVAKNVFGIYFCSPWLSDLGIPGFVKLIQTRGRQKPFEVLTRPPSPDNSWHMKMLTDLCEKCDAKIYYNSVLHAKIYVVMAQSGAFAIFGSPNLTKTARSNIEVALITYDKSFIDRLFYIFQIHLKRLCRSRSIK